MERRSTTRIITRSCRFVLELGNLTPPKEGEAAPVDMVMEFSVVPVGIADDVSMAKFVGLSAKICAQNHIQHDVHLMGTVCEGTLDQCLDLIRDVMTQSLAHAPRAVMNVKFDARPGEVNRLSKKAKKLHQILHESKEE